MDSLNRTAAGAARSASETIEKAQEIGEEAAEETCESARDFASQGLEYLAQFTTGISGFARREPWIAVAGAFFAGYLTARMLRSLE